MRGKVLMYSYNSRVGFSMVDADKNITINAIVDYFQNAATFHSEDIGVGYDYLTPKDLVWVVNTWQIDILRFPRYLDRVQIDTLPYKYRGFLGYRNFRIVSEKGEVLVLGNSMWSLINTKTMKPEMISPEHSAIYGNSEPLEMDYQKGKIRLPEHAKEGEEITVTQHFLDPNKHVNNGEYVNIAMTFLPEGFKIKRMRAEYRAQAFLGDVIKPVYGEEKGKYTVSLNNTENKPYAVLEFE